MLDRIGLVLGIIRELSSDPDPCLIASIEAKLRSKRLRRSHDSAEPSSPRCAVHVVTKHLVMEKYDGRDSRWRVGHSEEALQNSCCQRMRTSLKNTAIVFHALKK